MALDDVPDVHHMRASGTSKLLLTVPEAAAALGLSRSKFYELIARRAVRSVRIDGSRRVPVEALEAYVSDLLAAEDSYVARS